MGIIHSKNSLFKLLYKSEEFSDVSVEIIDSRNEVVFREVIKRSNGFLRPYNFSNLAEGSYTIKLDNGSNWMTEKVEYSKGKVTAASQVIALGDGKYMLSVAGSEDESFSLTVTTAGGEVIYSDSEFTSGNSAKIFNPRHVKGPFTFEITGQNGYSKTIIK